MPYLLKHKAYACLAVQNAIDDCSHAYSPAAKLRDESLQSAEQMAILRRQGCSAGRSTGCPWPQYKLPSGAYVFPANVDRIHELMLFGGH